jgi:signal transduction histidine kinase/CheY-like chemotaxis protein
MVLPVQEAIRNKPIYKGVRLAMSALLHEPDVPWRDVPEVLLPRWQQTIDLMARIYEVPAGLIMRVHTEQIEVFLASHSQGNPYEMGERADLQTGLYCETVMAQRNQLYVPNALEDPLWDHNPDIDLGMTCYLGVPLCWPDDKIFGTICVLDSRIRHYSRDYQELIWQFKEIIEGDLRLLAELHKRQQVEAELRAAKEAAEVANRAKSTFLANMSHELRTPLNAILGFTQLMNRSPNLAPDIRSNLGIVRRSGEHLLGLINNVLDLSRIEAGYTELHEANFDLHQFLDDLEDMFELRIADKGLRLVFERAPEVPRYGFIDYVKLRQVLINLLGNAVKFTAQGEVVLRVRDLGPAPTTTDSSGAPSPAPEARLLQFVVEDTGCGIAPDDLPRIFDAFSQTNNGKQAQDSTGLGLSISRRFVHLLGGEITVQSEVGRGSVFTVTIPLRPGSPTTGATDAPRRQVIGLAPDQPTYRILVVDDRWANRHLMVQLLAPLGFEVREASNGQEALEVWDSWQPHLVWMDMRMPVMDGYEATRRIKTTTGGQATAVVALTASTLEEERAVVLSAGCDDFMRKPFQESQIFEMMQKHLGVRYRYAEPEQAPAPKQPSRPAVTPEALAALPEELLAALEQAVLTTSPDAIEQVIEQIHSYDSELAHALTALTEEFAYAQVLALLQDRRNHYVT